MNYKFNEAATCVFEYGLKSISGLEGSEAAFMDGEGFE